MAAGGLVPPTSYRETISGDEGEEWRAAADAEIAALRAKGTFTLVLRPTGCKVLPTIWVFTYKLTAEGTISKRKARLVAGGHRQLRYVDYDVVHAPVGRHESLRALLAWVAATGSFMEMVDISNAFLNADLDEDVYISIPEGYPMGHRGSHVFKLNKTLYGLAVSPRRWYEELSSTFYEAGFVRSESDQGLFFKGEGEQRVNVYVYVDDIAIASKDKAALDAAKQMLLTKYQGKDLGEADVFLGIHIARDRLSGTVSISQPTHTEAVLSDMGMLECTPKSIPLSPGADTSATKPAEVPLQPTYKLRYQQAVGALLYISTVTRPDLAISVNILARNMSNPSMRHWLLLKGVLHYLAGTRNYGITYGKTSSGLVAYSDSDWGSDTDSRRSRSGSVALQGGGAVAWSSKMQSVVAPSTAEAEYVAAAALARAITWLQRIVFEISGVQVGAVPIHADNQACIFMASNSADTARTKHIDISHHYLRDSVRNRVVRMVKCSTNDNIADPFTKPLAADKFRRFNTMMGCGSVE